MTKIIREIIINLFPKLIKEQVDELVSLINYVIYKNKNYIEYTCLEMQDMCLPIYNSLLAIENMELKSFLDIKKLLKIILINKSIDFLRKHNRVKDRALIEGTKKSNYKQTPDEFVKIDKYQFDRYGKEILVNQIKEFIQCYILKPENEENKLVLLLFADGYTCRQISIELERPYREVKKIIEAFKENARKYFQ